MQWRFWKREPIRYRAYDPTPLIHCVNNHAGKLSECVECNAIKAKYPDADFTSNFSGGWFR